MVTISACMEDVGEVYAGATAGGGGCLDDGPCAIIGDVLVPPPTELVDGRSRDDQDKRHGVLLLVIADMTWTVKVLPPGTETTYQEDYVQRTHRPATTHHADATNIQRWKTKTTKHLLRFLPH